MPAALLGSHVTLPEVERCHIQRVLESVGGHKKRAAEILEINPSTLYRKLLRYDSDTEMPPEDGGEPAAYDDAVPVGVGCDDEFC